MNTTFSNDASPTLWQQLIHIYNTVFCPDQFIDRKKRLWRIHLFSFFVPFVLMALIYGSIGIWPFAGPNSILILDMNSQYVQFFQNLRNIIFGDNSILYSWSRALGGEFMGMYAYYLASPLSWIILLFPASSITDALWLILVIKTGICGLTMSVFLENIYPTKTLNTVLFSTLYALSAYNLMYMNNVMWMDAVMLLPLLALGIERLLSNGKYILFTSMLALIILSNYYIGFMVCVFTALYFIYYHIARGRIAGTRSETERFFFLKSLLRIGIFSAIAIAIAAIIIFPAYYSLKFGKLEYNTPEYNQSNYRNLLGILSKIFFGQTDTVRPSGLPFIYCGMISLFCLPVFFISKIKIREKIGNFLFLLVFIVSFTVCSVDILWHGGHVPNWLNSRYGFLFCFLFTVIAYRGFGHICDTRFRYLLLEGGVFAVFLLLMQWQHFGSVYTYYRNLRFDYRTLMICVNLLIICSLVVLLYLYRKHFHFGKRAGAICLTVFVLFEAYASGVLHNIALAVDLSYTPRETYVNYFRANQPSVNYIHQSDDGFYRMEKTYYRSVNDNMALNIHGISGSTSTLNAKTLNLLHKMGYRATDFMSWYYGGNPANDALLDIKYVISTENQSLPEIYDLIYTDEENGYSVYENPYALGLAFAVHSNLLKIDDTVYENPIEYINTLVSAMVGYPCNVFRPLTVSSTQTSENPSNEKEEDSSEHTDSDAPTYTVYGTGEPVYMYIPYEASHSAKTIKKDCKVDFMLSAFCYSNITSVGKLDAGKKYEIAFQTGDGICDFGTTANYLYSLDYDTFEATMQQLQKNQLKITPGFTEDHISGKLTVTEEYPVLFTSIPYDEGWKIYVDGKPVSPTSSLSGALIALKLSPGEHEVEFIYRPDALLMGAGVSLAGLAVFGGVIGASAIRKKRIRSKQRTM